MPGHNIYRGRSGKRTGTSVPIPTSAITRRFAAPVLSAAFIFVALSTGMRAQTATKARDPGPRGGVPGIGLPLQGLSAAERAAFDDGKVKFEDEENVREPNPGLGPRFNSDSCVSCHSHPATGGTSPPVNPLPAIASRRGAVNQIPPFITSDGPIREARLKCTEAGSNKCGVLNLFTISRRDDAPGCVISQPDFPALHSAGKLAFRIPTPVAGLGLVENISDLAILANAAADSTRKATLGIAGMAARNPNDGTISRFGWKAQNKSLLLFAAEAYNVEMGVTNDLFPQERAETDVCIFNALPEDRVRVEATRVSDAIPDVQKFTNFMRMLAPPVPALDTPSISNGRQLFATVGCAMCHTPSMRTGPASAIAALNNRDANLYSDLLLHDMGTGLQDDITQGLANASVFRTTPLWGLGQRQFFLHDGRTKDLLEAIQAHSSPASEANKVVNGFNGLSEAQKQDVLNFLRSL